MLRVSVLGHLGGDAELRYSTKGTPIAGFSVAVNQTRTGANGEREDSAEWFRINVAGRQAEFAAQLKKGQRVLAIGRLQISHFQRKDGKPGTGFDVWADEVQNVSARSAGADGEDGRTAVGAAIGDLADEPSDLEDLPF
jgi:single-strand DNA-binding protein